MEKNKKNQGFKTSEVVILVLLTFIVSLIIGILFGKQKIKSKEMDVEDEYLNSFIKNYNYVINNYYKEVDKEKIINGAIEGMMSSLEDPYSMYFNSNESSLFNVLLEGEYYGLGVLYSKNTDTNQFVITSVLKNSPAYNSGLKSNDIILSIDEKELNDNDLEELSNYVSNNDKVFKLKILRNGKESVVEISKEKVNIESVDSKVIEKDDKKIGYISISIFASNTYKQFKAELQNLEQQNIDSLIIDVRQNTGGHLTTVENILNEFLTKDQVSYVMEKNNEKTKYYGKAKENKKYSIVLLGDSDSASASEVLISSLRDNLNSYFIGEKTYGKGSVQELVTLPNGTQYKITTQRWLTPKLICVSDTKGIKPDKEVALSEEYYKTFKDEDDNQLQEAINYLSK